MNITILGAGAFGIVLSSMFLENDCNITIWTKFETEKEILERYRCHKKVLPDYIISDSIRFTTDMSVAVNDAKIVVIAIPIKFIDDTIKELKKYYRDGQYICISSKGIE